MNKKESIKLKKKLNKYAEKHYNVLLVGKHGIGKTEMIKSVFNDSFGKLNKDWLYFSASTMDPWIDFIGIPKNFKNASGKEVFKVIPPENFDNSEVTAIYFDEFNRSDEKIRNAVMELIQFKSINGRKFKNLKCIWAAINPFDDEEELYQVEELDPAQLDRFQIQIDLPYSVSLEFFENKYGETGIEVCKWWNRLSNEHKNLVSPRRLDYAVDVYQNDLDVRDVFNNKINSQSFIETVSVVEGKSYLIKIFKENDRVLLKSYLTLNRIQNLLPVFDSNVELLKFSVGFFPKDFLLSLLDSKYTNIKNYILSNIDSKKIEPFAGSSVFLSLMYFKKIKESTVKDDYLYYKESNKFVADIKTFNYDFELSSFLKYFSDDLLCHNDFCFNFIYQLYLLDKKPLTNYLKFFEALSQKIDQNVEFFEKNYIKNKSYLTIFIIKITYFYLYLQKNETFELNFDVLQKMALKLLNTSNPINSINAHSDIFNRINNLNSVNIGMFEKRDDSLFNLPQILNLNYKK
jgi:hypothetical protein